MPLGVYIQVGEGLCIEKLHVIWAKLQVNVECWE